MKDFFSKYSYGITKMFVNQFVMSLFGTVLAMATASAGNNTMSLVLTLVVSCFAILFYLFLIYTMTWEIGAKDKISVDVGKKEYRPMTGLWMSLVANIPNFIIALLYTIAYPVMDTARWAGTMAAFSRIASVIIEGMYLGLTSTIQIAGTYMNRIWWTYFLITVPAIVTSFVAYYLGHKNFRFWALITNKKDDDNR